MSDAEVAGDACRGPLVFPSADAVQSSLERRRRDRRAIERRGARRSAPPRPDEQGAALRDACHDLRQPIAAAQMLAAALRTEVAAPMAAERLYLLETQLLRMSEMVAQLLDPPASAPLDLADLVREAAATLAGVGVALELALDGPVVVHGDRLLLGRALLNLLQNACRAAGAGRRVRVCTWTEGHEAHLVVSDEGRRTESAAPGPGSASGYGLGLLIVDGVVRRHGGRVTAGPGDLGGLEVSVSLPAAAPGRQGVDL